MWIKLLLLLLLLINQCLADDLLAGINRQLTKAPITQGKFRQEKRLTFLAKPLLSEGSFTYHQQLGIIWQTQTPLQSTLIMNDSAMLAGTEKQAIPPAFGHVFKALLGGEINQLVQNFTVTGKQQQKTWRLQLTPKDDMLKKAINTIAITGDSEVRDWELQETSGNRTLIHFSGISHPGRLGSEQQAGFEKISP